jgi:hypothetical protein
MNVAKSLIATLLLAAASLAPVAHAAVINFNGMTGTGTINGYGSAPVANGGYNFASTENGYVTGSDYAGNTDSGYYAYNGTDFYMSAALATVTRANALPFKLTSIDLAMWAGYSGAHTATLTGSKVGGGTVTQTVNLNTLGNGSKTTGNDFVTYFFTGFDNLSSLAISNNYGYYLAMDNFVLSAASIPEPSSMALFGLAVAAGAFARRRAAKSA